MAMRILPILAAAILIVPAVAAEPDASKPPSQSPPAAKMNQAPASAPAAPPMEPPVSRSLRRQTPTGSGGDGGRPDETVGGLPGAKPAIPDKQP